MREKARNQPEAAKGGYAARAVDSRRGGVNQFSNSAYARGHSTTNADLYIDAELFSREILKLLDDPFCKIAHLGSPHIVGSMHKIKFVADFDLNIKKPNQGT